MTKRLSIGEIRIELHKLENNIRKLQGKTKLSNQYLTKVRYMIMWMRLIPLNKKILKDWHMPDYSDISRMRKEVKE